MSNKSLRFDSKVILVTGAGRGLGRSYALYLAKLGAFVIVNDLGVARDGSGRSPTPAQGVVHEITSAGGAASADCSDVSSSEEAGALIAGILHAHGRIDGVINNAGIFLPPKPFLDSTLEEFERVWMNHCGGTYNICRAALAPMMAAGSGRIVNTCSTQGLYGGGTTAYYAAAKGAVQALTLSLAAAVRGTGVTVNGISPGGFTRMLENEEGRDADLVAALQSNLDPDLVAPAVAWLCHEACTENGEIIQAYAGRISRTIIGELDGFWDFEPSIESVAAALTKLPTNGPVSRAQDSATRVRGVFAEADRHQRDGSH